MQDVPAKVSQYKKLREDTHRSEEARKWNSAVTSERPELSGCSSESSDRGCSKIDY
jgi:hypothetical protein